MSAQYTYDSGSAGWIIVLLIAGATLLYVVLGMRRVIPKGRKGRRKMKGGGDPPLAQPLIESPRLPADSEPGLWEKRLKIVGGVLFLVATVFTILYPVWR